ncbi:MAG: CHRD domain-containing protein [Armatimonadetes bacterium]|nr:CHRD domain-containing protein [Armatimonadota bacterium]
MRRYLIPSVMLALLVVCTSFVGATTLFEAVLSGLNEVPPRATPATGYASVLLSDDQTQVTINMNWNDLLAPATASHIHGPATTSTNGPVVIPILGVAGTTSGSISQTSAITPLLVSQLQSGLLYVNVHTSIYPGGEIRGQLYERVDTTVPEPSAVLLGILGLTSIGRVLRRGRA